MKDYRLHSFPVSDFHSVTICHYRKLHSSHFIVAMSGCHLLMPCIMGDMNMMRIKNILKPLKKITMNHFSIRKLELALGITGTLLYFGCAVVMLTLGHDSTVKIFNSLLHGLDVASIIRMDIPLVEVLPGLVQTFIISWLIGACIPVFSIFPSIKKYKPFSKSLK